MSIVRTGSLAVLVAVTLASSVWADSVVTPSAFKADQQIVQNSISKNMKLFQSSPEAKSALVAGQLAGYQALFQNSRGNSKAAQIDFQTAITDFNKVLSLLHETPLTNPSFATPDAGSLALLGCSGLAIFGALKRKFVR